MNTQCLFCNIARGDIPSEKVYEDDHVVAFLDITPINHGHTLVIPKTHATNVFDIECDSWLHVMNAVHTLAPQVQSAINADGINITVNNNEAAGQSVFHPHVHIIPRHENDGHHLWKGGTYAEGEAEQVGERIRSAQKK